MATTLKKRDNIEPKMGRPLSGALITYPKTLIDKIKYLRQENKGWGPITILLELELEYGYSKSSLPSSDSVWRYLKQEGFMKPSEPKGILPTNPCKAPKEVHELWEMDAQGAIEVSGIGHQATINMKDSLSKKYCVAFPVAVKNSNSQPSTIHYKWAFRLAFVESGLPKVVQVDKDSVFIENSSKSPYPSRLHLWLLALGVDLCFITVPPPKKQAMVERSHQTIEKQAMRGKHFESWQQLFKNVTKRRKRLNENYPSRSLGKKAPLEVYPEANHSGRIYKINQESKLLDLNRIYNFLIEGEWYRIVSNAKMISLGAKRYYLKKAIPKSQLKITFKKKTKQLIFRNVNEHVVAQLPVKGISIEELMGDSAKNLILMNRKLKKNRGFPL